MNKEAIVAIIIGVALGLFGAIFFSNFGKVQNNSTNTSANFQATGLTPRATMKSATLATFSNLPKNNALLNKNSITISGKAEASSHLFLANQLELTPIKINKTGFEQSLKLKPGLNEIVLFELNQDKEQLKVLKVFYFEPQNLNLKTETKEATKEADLLKEKLEDKVLELRNSPKQVISGEIKSINGKIITLVSGSETEKITVEPEITNFFSINNYQLQTIKFDSLDKGQTITAFISDIGGEEISYTVYQEPEITVAAGKVSNIDEDNYQITIIDYDKSSYGADIQVGTTQNLYNLKSRQIEKAGFSKLAIGQRILAIISGTKGSYSVDEYLILP